MAFFLKKTSQNKRTFLSIVNSFYDPNRKGTAHKTYKSLGSIESLIENGIADPISFYQKEVDELNEQRQQDGADQISQASPIRYLGYFPIKAIMEKLEIKKFVDLFKITTSYSFDLYEILSALVYARCVKPCSKHKTFHDVIPCLFEPHSFSYDQLLDGLYFYGNNYEKFVEMFTVQTKAKYGLDTHVTYFDCTNFYFEIYREDDFRRKGPSKERRTDPIIGLGLLLDANQIPISMRMYPGNESEKPLLRDIVNNLKESQGITGRTIQVADKGLNCAQNIYNARENGDGYLFSKSVKQLPDKEKVWVLLDSGYQIVKDSDGRELYRYKECVDKFPYDYTDSQGVKHRLLLTEKRVVTFNASLAKKKIFEINRMVEKARSLCVSQAQKSEYGEASKYVLFKGKQSEEDVKAVINQDAINNDLRLAGYNLLVTSETKMEAKEIYATYHNLWRIEESFRIMKSDLDARPVFLQTEETIKGHFLICYIAVVLERILQFIVLRNRFSSNDLYSFFKEFIFIKSEYGYTNLSSANSFMRQFAQVTSLPIMNLHFTEKKINKVLNYKV